MSSSAPITPFSMLETTKSVLLNPTVETVKAVDSYSAMCVNMYIITLRMMNLLLFAMDVPSMLPLLKNILAALVMCLYVVLLPFFQITPSFHTKVQTVNLYTA